MPDGANYKYIVIEGNIGAGKTTFATQIAKKHNAKLLLEQFSDNPFLPKFYENPDKYSFALEMSFMADRYSQLKNNLREQDLFKDFTVSDYYFMKSLIFSKQTLSDDEYNLYRQFFTIIYQSLPKPDLYVYLHMDVDRLMEQIKKRGRDYERHITPDYLKKIQGSYFEFFKQHDSEMQFLILDVNRLDFVAKPEDFSLLEDTILHTKQEKNARLIL